MNALKSLVSGLITAASTALILFGSGAHGQEVKDPATLPPIETIDAQTDITVFLQNGVPNELRLAALRRAWPFVSHQYLNVIFDVNDIVDQPKRSASCRR